MATELAQAYVQILPTTKGIKGQLESQLGGEASKAGDSAGGILGGGLAKKALAIIAAAGIGKKIVDGISAAVKEGGSLEQSIGGIETLFKDSSDKVINNAKKAFSTAGMSANEYMENVTSFSASLLQGLGGDTSKAAEVADMAMVDMSDNANKMGTSMESIQTAYQGFAKQNYTMLDNLKLGYGGTKSEMERLLSDAQELTGVEYNIDNLSDVYEAIHVIQGELDITGTTAKEASTTLQGSFSAMQASWTNLLGYMATGEDLTEPLNNLVSTASTFLFGNLLPMIGNVLSALPGAIKTLFTTAGPELITQGQTLIPQLVQGMTSSIPELLTAGQGAVSNLLDTITAKLPDVLSKGEEIIGNISDGFWQKIPVFITKAGEMISKLLSFILQNLPKIVESGANILLKIVSGFVQNIPQIIDAVRNMLGNIVTTIGSHLPEILQKGVEIVGKLVAGIIKMIPDIAKAIPKIIDAIENPIANVDWISLGKNIIQGIVNGIKNAASTLLTALKNLASQALNAAKEALKIHSPSVAFEDEIGEQIPPGMAKGIINKNNVVRKAIQDISKDALSAAKLDFSTSSNVSSYKYAGQTAEIRDDERLANLIVDALGRSGLAFKANDREVARLIRRYA